ncbi:MAG: Molybdopterin molybdenumtransferase [Candidatus Heimdallarchaeota archaeon LC_2]|nr:MAG: Molybdopterin molybdenumtransferase [Candidatus Heimdallarchaeota archaeon LC_2]
MSRKIFRELISVEEARTKFYQYAPLDLVGVELLSLLETLGRVLAEDIFSPIDVPPFDRSAMDGFAVIANDTLGAAEDSPNNLEVIGDVQAGYVFDGLITGGNCVEISTGAPLPAGADSVVMVEYTQREKNNVDIYKPASPGQNVMSAGADIQKGELILLKGTLLSSRELSVLAAIGQSKILVYKKPKIGIFSSGDEVISADQTLTPGKLFDINSIAISAGINENGGDPTLLGIIEDDFKSLERKIGENLSKYDLLIISGGTSAGMGDMLFEVVDNLGDPGLLVHGIKVKPGKPTILAVCQGVPVIGLPGYPASALSIFQLFVVPYVRKIAGLSPVGIKTKVKAKVKQRLRSVMGRHEFKPMNLIKSETGWLAFPVPGGSGAITSIALADGFVEIPDNETFVLPNTEVEITLFSDKIKPIDLQIIGSHCSVLAKIIQALYQKYPEYHSRLIGVGTTGGIAAIRRGEAHVAGIHLLSDTGEYNKLDQNEVDAFVIPGYYRMQGFIVPKGNPKNINKLTDLIREDVLFMNRNPGSGTRVLLDYLLLQHKLNSDSIKGYSQYSKSHSSVAAAVKSGVVDVGLGIQSAIDDDLDFIPLKEEEYDFLINNNYRHLPAVNAFIDILKSERVTEIINNFPGYRKK